MMNTYTVVITVPGVNRWTLTREHLGGSGWRVRAVDAAGATVFTQNFDTQSEAVEAIVDKVATLVREAA